MNLHDFLENEKKYLSVYAQLSENTKGREYPITPCDMRTCYQRDYDRILHSKSFRRLKHKTQVFFSPEGDHYRTRLTHTLEVAQIARTISRLLSLNEALTEAIAIGHDLGHTPFGHSGERALNDMTGNFSHNKQSLRVVEVLENDSKGLNLTYEVRDGIKNHKKDLKPGTLEGFCVNYADRIAYINHDIDDAIRAGIIKNIPEKFLLCFGGTHGERINNMIRNIVLNSENKPHISMSLEYESMLNELRDFMFEQVYFNIEVKGEGSKAENLVKSLYEYFYSNIDKFPHPGDVEKYGKEQAITDYIAGMTDRYAVNTFDEIFIPKGWRR